MCVPRSICEVTHGSQVGARSSLNPPPLLEEPRHLESWVDVARLSRSTSGSFRASLCLSLCHCSQRLARCDASAETALGLHRRARPHHHGRGYLPDGPWL